MNKKYIIPIAISLILLNSLENLQAFACAPDYDQAVFVSWIHPDFPLKNYAAGDLGIIQTGWARSYLCVAYRYLTGQGLVKEEQSSIERLWVKRLSAEFPILEFLAGDAMKRYIDLRCKVLKIKSPQSTNLYYELMHFSRDNDIEADSFVEALATLQARIKHYGENSNAVLEWINGQDCVYGINKAKKMTVPEPLNSVSDKTLREDRDYQRAAAKFYLKDYFNACDMFKSLARNKQSSRFPVVSYMVARCRAYSSLCAGAPESRSEVIASLEKQAALETHFERKEDLIDLIGWLRTSSQNQGEDFDNLVQSVTSRTTSPLAAASFGHNVSDLTFLITQSMIDPAATSPYDIKEHSDLKVEEHDLTDWLDTIYDGYDPFSQTPEELAAAARRTSDPGDGQWIKQEQERLSKHRALLEQRANHALRQWRTHHSIQWLVAVMLCGGLRSAERADALSAAEQLPPESPAYLTASFYVIDALSARGELEKARKILKSIMTSKEHMPLSTANLFKSQQLFLSTTPDDYLSAVCMRLIPSANAEVLLPSDWKKYESQPGSIPVLSGWDEDVARDLNRNLPYSLWLKLAHRTDLPANLHARVTCAVWLRSIFLGKTKDTEQFSIALAKAYPNLALTIEKFKNLPPGREKQFALASLILENYGMSPYVDAGLPRFAKKIDEFNYYQKNFWLPLPSKDSSDDDQNPWKSTVKGANSPNAELMTAYYKPGITRLLTADQRKEAERERQQIEKCHPSAFLGRAVLDEVSANTSAPELPELLYKIVKLPLWSGSSETGSRYSKAALLALKAHYPQNKWAKKVRYSY
ncbi:MAG: hypothetical protein P4L53_13570 [Candidatus Obscuribacterales bacterium]|nr:hypothetical protein [Candidatus Obscuribacterales bacterium]